MRVKFPIQWLPVGRGLLPRGVLTSGVFGPTVSLGEVMTQGVMIGRGFGPAVGKYKVRVHFLTKWRHSKHLLILVLKCLMQFSAELSECCPFGTNARMWDTSAPNIYILGPKCLYTVAVLRTRLCKRFMETDTDEPKRNAGYRALARGTSVLQSAECQRLSWAASGYGIMWTLPQTLSRLYTSGRSSYHWRQPSKLNRMIEAKAYVACIVSVLLSMIEALDEDECTPQVFEFVVGMACGHILWTVTYYRCDLWINSAPVSPYCLVPS